ncbi:DUF4247 domain-containing protein [Catenuloplanes indicus]|uniref:Drug/metabolite transporter (DMT)-like permease n=1 Tax=Catenuloplanes indicus TaxID=137267 RepID=A0AAE3W207_9ACTN|nr:DUF4247 domain-containing protein [Catenuloplanes indicus]MDQ0367886.1 drug/metabolite transporter (DMT)-like permease [Catenuloplanes indicus]
MTKHRRWFTVGIVLAVVGALVAGWAILYGNFSVRGYVDDKFQRSASNDIGDDAVAYASNNAPTAVAAQITKAWEPADEVVDASGVYLRYADDAVVILPAAVGSLILIEDIDSARRRYSGHTGGYWGWGSGNTIRGGGPGSGK